jgi:hypothetical protein
MIVPAVCATILVQQQPESRTGICLFSRHRTNIRLSAIQPPSGSSIPACQLPPTASYWSRRSGPTTWSGRASVTSRSSTPGQMSLIAVPFRPGALVLFVKKRLHVLSVGHSQRDEFIARTASGLSDCLISVTPSLLT